MPEFFAFLVIAIVIGLLLTIGFIVGWLVRKLLRIKPNAVKEQIRAKRCIAAVVDGASILVISATCAPPVFMVFSKAVSNLSPQDLRQLQQSLGQVTTFAIICLYFILFECSVSQATPGKESMKLYVVDSQKQPISIWTAILPRLWQCVVISLIVNSPSIMGSLDTLINSHSDWWIFFSIFLLFGLIGLGYLGFKRFFPTALGNRLVLEDARDSSQSQNTSWSLRKALTFNLNKSQSCFGLIGLLLAIGCPFAAISFGHYVDNNPDVAKTAIVYTTKDINGGEFIAKDMLKMGTIPVGRLPKDASVKVKFFDQAIGRVSTRKVSAGEILDIRYLWTPPADWKVDRQAHIMQVPVLYAIKEIPEGHIIPKDALTLKTIPISETSGNTLASLDQAAGHIAACPICAGHQIFSNYIKD